MTARFLALTLLLPALLAGGCRSSSDPAAVQENFGVRMAKMNLWREAMFRFQRAVEINPESAMSYNNLAVALEANGDFEGAAKAYRQAMRLDRSNEYIQKNYSRFVEFTTRERRRQQDRPAAAQTAAAPEAAAAAPATTSDVEPPPNELPATGPEAEPQPVPGEPEPVPADARPLPAEPQPAPADPQPVPPQTQPPGGSS